MAFVCLSFIREIVHPLKGIVVTLKETVFHGRRMFLLNKLDWIRIITVYAPGIYLI